MGKSTDGTILDAFVAWGASIAIVCLFAWMLGYAVTSQFVMLVAVVTIICLPPSLDPAIQIKLRVQKGREDA